MNKGFLSVIILFSDLNAFLTYKGNENSSWWLSLSYIFKSFIPLEDKVESISEINGSSLVLVSVAITKPHVERDYAHIRLREEKWVAHHVIEVIYKLYVRPHLDYGDVIYHDQHTVSMDLLEKIQYQAGLIVTNCWKGTSRAKLYKELGWEPLSQRRTGRRFALYHKILNNHTPQYLKNHIQDFLLLLLILG